jgi:hypothetical protein
MANLNKELRAQGLKESSGVHAQALSEALSMVSRPVMLVSAILSTICMIVAQTC